MDVGNLLIHCPPQKRIIRYSEMTYYVSLPDMIFQVVYYGGCEKKLLLDSLYVYFADKNLENLGYPCLPNIGMNCCVCLGRCLDGINSETPISLVKNTIDCFWNSEFTWSNVGALQNYYLKTGWSYLGGYLSFLIDWQNKTKTCNDYSPEFVFRGTLALKEDWEPYGNQ